MKNLIFGTLITMLTLSMFSCGEDFDIIFGDDDFPVDTTECNVVIAIDVDNSGELTATASGGTAPYIYLWSNGELGSTIMVTEGGSYTVVATDSEGCTATATVNYTNSPCQGFNVYPDIEDIEDGIMTFEIIGGTPPYTYYGATTTETVVTEEGEYFIEVTEDGENFIEVIDSEGCNIAITFFYEDPNDPCSDLAVTLATTETSIEAIASGGATPYTYDWSNNETTAEITDLASGSYTVTVTGANGCTTSASTSIGENTGDCSDVVITADIPDTLPGTLSVEVSGSTPSTTYIQWSTLETGSSITVSEPGTYTVYITVEFSNSACYFVQEYIIP